ncbi:hypothetical protein [Tunturiibacter gelidoferens]|uniref:hypothetical protein n=1 Tax=Tunturiibacter gelidiferens TaxID=3069689 RepID=UPI00161FAEF4|nr:hypothetical protein [Edaphobacter lichenicola]
MPSSHSSTTISIKSIQAEACAYGAKCVALARVEVRDDPSDATAKRDLGSLASPVGALRMEASNSPSPSSTPR